MKRLATAILPLLLLGCSAGAVPKASEPAPAPAPVADPAPGPVAPAPADPPRLELIADAHGFRVEARAGELGPADWVGPAHLLVQSFPLVDGPRPTTIHLVNLDTGRIRPLVTAGVVHPAGAQGSRVALAWLDGTVAGVTVADRATGEPLMTLEHRGEFYGPPQVKWTGPEHLVATFTPAGVDVGGRPWGSVFLLDLRAKTSRLLAERGELAAVFGDGSLLLRRGWYDGELVRLDPPYTGEPTRVAPGGPWTWGFGISADGNKAAWLEVTPPPGDWSTRLPHSCCSGDPTPHVHGAVFYERATGHVTRHSPLDGYKANQNLTWRTDGSGVLLEGAAYRREGMTLTFLGADGRITGLAEHLWAGGRLQVAAQGPDGSIYYTAAGRQGQTHLELMRLKPDAKVETLADNRNTTWWVDTQGRWVTLSNGPYEAVERDLTTDAVRKLPVAPALQAPGGAWILAAAADTRSLAIRRGKE